MVLQDSNAGSLRPANREAKADLPSKLSRPAEMRVVNYLTPVPMRQ